MKILILIVASLVFVAGSSLAQVPAKAEAEQRAAVKELLDAMNFKQMMAQVAGPMMQQMAQLTDDMVDKSSSRGTLSPEQVAELRNTARESSARSLKAVTDLYNDPQVIESYEGIMARAYARNFTLDEIKAITAFYVSPAGKKTLSVLPKQMQETMPEIIGLIVPRMNAIKEAAAKDLTQQIERASKVTKSDTAK